MRTSLCLALLLAVSSLPAHSQASPGREARATARAWREAHESEILREFSTLLALPNVASNLADIRANADLLMRMLRARGAETRLLEVEGAPPSVYGEITVPGATRTIMLYAHYDGQPVNPRQWAGAPFTPVLRDKALYAGGR
jgi:acetylornithine deacetylase/succinyl-diaminopimelate desuccinylase-like protein